MVAVALDGRVDVASAAELLHLPVERRYPYGWVFAADGGRLYLFAFGAAVLEAAARIEEPRHKLIERATGRHLLPNTADTYWVRVAPQHESSSYRVAFDQVVIPGRTPELVGAVALLLGQSAALERYEVTANRLVDEALALSRDLASGARLPFSTKALVRRIGELTADRLELARWFYLVDRPPETWEDAQVATLYDALFVNLELPERHRAMLHKLSAVESATSTAIDLWQGSRSNALEIAIVLLIVFEIAHALLAG